MDPSLAAYAHLITAASPSIRSKSPAHINVNAQPLMRVAHGLYIPARALPKVADQKQAFVQATLVRAAALTAKNPAVCVTGEAALTCHGLETWSAAPQIWHRVSRRSSGRSMKLLDLAFQTIDGGEITVPASSSLPIRSLPVRSPAGEPVAGKPVAGKPVLPRGGVASPEVAAVQLALRAHPLVAINAASQVLRAQVSAGRRDPRTVSPSQVALARQQFFRAFEEVVGDRQVKVAEAAIELADPRLESAGEVLLWWLLHRVGAASWLDIPLCGSFAEVSTAWQSYVSAFESDLREVRLPLRRRSRGVWRDPEVEVLCPFQAPSIS